MRFEATSAPQPTYCTLSLPPRVLVCSSPTLATLQTSNLNLTSVNVRHMLLLCSRPATGQPRQHCASCRQHRVPSLPRPCCDPAITVSECFCRRSGLRMFLILYTRFSVLLGVSSAPKGVVLSGDAALLTVLDVMHTTIAANVSPSRDPTQNTIDQPDFCPAPNMDRLDRISRSSRPSERRTDSRAGRAPPFGSQSAEGEGLIWGRRVSD